MRTNVQVDKKTPEKELNTDGNLKNREMLSAMGVIKMALVENEINLEAGAVACVNVFLEVCLAVPMELPEMKDLFQNMLTEYQNKLKEKTE